MIAGRVPIKTADGQAELTARRRSVSQRHRTVLFLVDGKRNIETVRAMAAAAGVAPGCVDDLLALRLIMLVESTFSMVIDTPIADELPMHVDLPLSDSDQSRSSALDSMLPPSRSLFGESLAMDSTLGLAPMPEDWLDANPADPSDAGGSSDARFVEAREILLRAVRTEAPLAGSLTLLRLRRARTRADLIALLDECETRISKPHRALAATQTMRRVRALLQDGLVDSSRASA